MKDKPVNILFSGMTSWYINHTARESEKIGSLSGYWMGNKRPVGVPVEKYKRIWPYHLAQKAFYHLPFANLEEQMRWNNLPFYDAWIKHQTLPASTNVVQAPMGSCEALFRLANQTSANILKVFDAPNSHPTSHYGYWQRECDIYYPGYTVPTAHSVRSKINRELEMADMILCPSFFVRDTMVTNGIPKEKCFVSHFGVDTDVFKAREGIPKHPRFICVGSITLRKGHQYLFRAFQKVKEKYPASELICVGGVRPDFHKEMRYWKGTFTHYENMTHNELAKELTSCTAFILPSLEEGFARVLSEAMAAGLPILASYESGATTVVRNGIEGYIIEPRNIDSISRSMIDMIKDTDKNISMGKSAHFSGAISNTWTDYTHRIIAEYQKRLKIP
jgi:glycosyltransferase involved in cell wall biosynthesis